MFIHNVKILDKKPLYNKRIVSEMLFIKEDMSIPLILNLTLKILTKFMMSRCIHFDAAAF